jgi:hypothetical protein
MEGVARHNKSHYYFSILGALTREEEETAVYISDCCRTRITSKGVTYSTASALARAEAENAEEQINKEK